MINLVLASVFVVGAAGTAVWVSQVLADNARLETDNNTLIDANSSYVNAMHAMAQEQVKLNQQIIQRDNAQRSIQRDLAQSQQRLRDAKHDSTITDIQRQCVDSDIPAGFLNVLRSPAADSGQDKSTDKTLPSAIVFRSGSATHVSRLDLGGSRGVCRGAEGGCSNAARGPSSDSGILQ